MREKNSCFTSTVLELLEVEVTRCGDYVAPMLLVQITVCRRCVVVNIER